MTKWYLSPTGSDSNSGRSAQQAFATFPRADLAAQPGDEVKILPGIFTLTNTVSLTSNGASGKSITWTSENTAPWKNPGSANNPMIFGGNPTGEVIQLVFEGSYINVYGLEFADPNANVGIDMWGQHCECKYHYIHDYGTNTGGTTPGAGIFDRGNVGAGYNEIAYNIIVRINSITATSVNNSVFHCIYFSGTHDFVHHNICISAPGYGIYCSGSTNYNDHPIVANNLCAENGNSGIAFGCISGAPVDYMYCLNNIVMNNGKLGTPAGYGIREVDGNSQTGVNSIYLYNLTYNNSTGDYFLQNGLTPQNPIYGTPTFINYQPDGSGDYHQVLGSAGIDTGIGQLPSWSTWNWAVDLDGSLVPLGVGWDIGPYEYIAAHGGVAIFDQTTGLAVFGGIAGGIKPFFLHGKSDNAGISDVSEQLYVYDSSNPGQFGPWQYGQIWLGNVDPFTRQSDSVWGAVHEGDLWFNDSPSTTNQNTRVGPTATPNSAANWYSGSGTQKWIKWLANLTGTITSISFYADGDGSTSAGFYGCVWSAAGTLLGNTSIGHFSGGARHIGQQHWHTLSGISVPITSGTTYIIGFQNDNTSLVDWSTYSSLSSTYSGFGYNTQSTFPGNLGSGFTPYENLPIGLYFVVTTTTGAQAHISLCRNGAWVTIVA